MLKDMTYRNIKIVGSIEEATLITHGGTFHADECMGTAILSYVIPGSGAINVARVSGNTALTPLPGQFIYDVGFGPFDHHQRGGNGVRENGIPYAACGLIWKTYGPVICANTADPNLVFNTIDRELIQPIDAQDCGYRNPTPMPEGYVPTPNFTLSNAVSAMNPTWDMNGRGQAAAFENAVEFCRTVFHNVFARAASKAKAKKEVQQCIMDTTGPIMTLPYFMPWEDFIFPGPNAPEELKAKAAQILYIVYPGNRGGFQFRVVPDKPGSFGQRNFVPDSWKGLNGQKLQEVTGVATATFVHTAGFIGGATDLTDCLELARKAIEEGTRNI